jgi:hypothetical protein
MLLSAHGMDTAGIAEVAFTGWNFNMLT